MTDTTADATDATPRYVYVRLPRCPRCDSTRLVAQRSVDNGDGTRTKYTKCRDCGKNTILILE